MEPEDTSEEFIERKKIRTISECQDENFIQVKEEKEILDTSPQQKNLSSQSLPLAQDTTDNRNAEEVIENVSKENEFDELQRLRDEYTQLKEQIRNDEVSFINDEIRKIESGEHEEINNQINLIKIKKEKKIFLAEQIHKHKCDSIVYGLLSDIQFANHEYDAEISQLKERTLQSLIKKCKQYGNEKTEVLNGESKVYSTRALKKKDKESSNYFFPDSIKLKALELQVKLTDEEIVQDLALITKGCS